jgi:hypothetical protein
MDVGRCRPLHHHAPSSSLKSEGRRESQWLLSSPLVMMSTTPTRAMLMMGLAGKLWPKRAQQPSAMPWCTRAHATAAGRTQHGSWHAPCRIFKEPHCAQSITRDLVRMQDAAWWSGGWWPWGAMQRPEQHCSRRSCQKERQVTQLPLVTRLQSCESCSAHVRVHHAVSFFCIRFFLVVA